MDAAILTIGDELLIGQVIDTNSAWLAMRLNELGITVKARFSVGDNMSEIRDALYYATELAPVVITTGGLGPTSDDRTREVLCDIFECEMQENEEVLRYIKDMFAKRGWPLTDVNRRQALVPDRAKVLFNKLGTAPGLYFEDGSTNIFVMPGVPFEMKEMFTNQVTPHLKKLAGNQVYVHETRVFSGIGESWLSDHIKPWEEKLPKNVSLAYLPAPGIIRLRLSHLAQNEQEGRELLCNLFTEAMPLVNEYFVSAVDEPIAATLLHEMIASGKTFCTAESCTGGYIAQQVTSIPGSSAAFKGSVVAYSNEIKEKLLNVSSATLQQYGAVSAQTVCEMALNARLILNTDYSMAVSGIAGPDGGTADKPVGLVWIAVASENGVESQELKLGGTREVIIARSAVSAMFMCLKEKRKEQK
ncbi:MAG: hypothetical protein A2W93_05700 [Bacteroidetes bacterium GWF2_43_63]|nr:MAG: hypothetical protein A2W94_07365 [Bacteroidetes bacterium GWE2_42_42]OFY55509.1 MAG: hypothetical protein A2W93_05700 [Bacteroidetes bacterium GWF2_43_63]HBG69988.1 competence/damage-inducible protein A [Bacteroidales bacterium]HCB62587.1 competence/damage-inducible protein A [Bacteroidales bacterium]HCY23707.1 competence/damage-inducible protein A [Bacteroidales bacterium]